MKKVLSLAIAVFVLSLSVLPVFAESFTSPKATTADYIIRFDDVDGGHAVAEYKTEVGEDGKQTVVITGVPDDGYDFVQWVIDGDYTTVGKLTDKTIELVISGDIHVKPAFAKKGEAATKPAGGEKVVDNSSKSPQTGSSGMAYAVFFVSAAALIAVVTIAKRRSAEK